LSLSGHHFAGGDDLAILVMMAKRPGLPLMLTLSPSWLTALICTPSMAPVGCVPIMRVPPLGSGGMTW